MTSIVATPNPGVVGKPISFIGEGFTGAAECALEVVEDGFRSEIVASAAGAFASDAIGDHATVTLTATGNAATTNTMTLDGVVYTVKSGTDKLLPYEVRLGGDASTTLDNLKAAVNNGAGEGTVYGLGTPRHPTIMAGPKTATTIVFYARAGGAAGNGLASTDTLANIAFGAGTLSGATAGAKAMEWRPTQAGTYTATATDGTNSASTRVRVFTA